MREIIISGQMKMADIIAGDQRAMVLMPRFGIDLGVGDKTVRQICREKGIHLDFFLLMVNVFLHPSYFPGKKLKNVDVNLLLIYLANSHEYYIREKVPSIQSLVGEFLYKLEQPARGQLDKFFREYIREVIEHIAYEEDVVFPYISSLAGTPPVGNGNGTDPSYAEDKKALRERGIREFEKRHNDIEEKLSDLKNLLIKYVPPASDRYLRIRILNELIDLEQDLADHARLEDKVLIPIVEELEKQLDTR